MFSSLRGGQTFNVKLFGKVLGITSRWQLSAVCAYSSHYSAPTPESINDLHPNSFKNIEVTTVGKVLVVGLNRPWHRNAVNRETASELYQAFRLFDSDGDVDVGVLYGKGGTFCSGYDLKEIAGAAHKHAGAKNKDCGADNETQNGMEWLLHACDIKKDFAPMGPSRLLLSKPVIAAVSGYAVAGGLELALLCDLRVADEEAVFGVFCRRFGVPLVDGGTVRLPALIGLSRAMDMILTGRPVLAKEALDIGLANRITPRGKSLEEALLLANQIAVFPQECLKTDRMSAYHSTYRHGDQKAIESDWLKQALAYEYSHGVKVLEKESILGASKFVKGFGRKGQFEQ